MTRSTRLRSFVSIPAIALAALALPILAGPMLAAPAAGAQDRTTDKQVRHWATSVWDAARRGDARSLEAEFDALPAAGLGASDAERFRGSLAQLRRNRTQSSDERNDQRETAMTAMRDELAAENEAKALRKAVEVQTLSADLNSAFGDEEIMDIVRWAEKRVPLVEASHNWLEAQELLYLLRTFYEDTTRRLAFAEHDESLERVNRRVGLIARYVPRRLHEMRNERAEDLGEETYGEFNPGTAVDWRERLDGVDHRMLKAALSTAAAEHIESAGWRPLMRGGLEALKLLATTEALAETFQSLDNDDEVRRWVRFIDRKLTDVKDARRFELDRKYLGDLLDDLFLENVRSLSLPTEVVLREFGDGALNELDTYSEIIWPDKLHRFRQATAGNFVGVGILIRHNDKREIMVVNPLEGTPAYFAGVKPNDLIMQVNGDATVGWSLNDAVDRITGPKGRKVRLGIKREGADDIVEIPIERDVIKIRSVKGWWKEGLDEDGDPIWDWFIDPASRIGYIRLTQFTEDSYKDIERAMKQMSAAGDPAGLILDLRHNPGGLLTSAVRISNLFVGEGSIVTGEDKDGNRAWGQDARPNKTAFASVPTVLLINRGSASASEIVAGCLQAHDAAIIVGERSFGKGSVQTIHHIARNGRLKLTTQYYRLPSPDGGLTKGRLVHKRPGAEVWGVDPDIEVPMSVKQVSAAISLRQAAEVIPLDDDGELTPDNPDRPDVYDLLTEGIDPQLETALLILQAQALAGDRMQGHARK